MNYSAKNPAGWPLTPTGLLFVMFLLQISFSSIAAAGDAPRSLEFRAEKLDWVQLVSGEWLTGKIHSMYNEELEFDSEKLKLLTIDWYDVKTLLSHQPLHVLFANGDKTSDARTGLLRVSDNKVVITNGDHVESFRRDRLISFAPAGQREVDLWTLKAGLGLVVQRGNTRRLDYTAKVALRRRTAKMKFLLDYIGNISQTDTVTGGLTKTVNNHRVTSKMDVYINRNFFYTPINAEFYRDPFRNIDQRITVGAGLGYYLFNTKRMTWEISAGPSFVTTRFNSVRKNEKSRENSLALVAGTNLDVELTSKLDLNLLYNINVSKKKSGGYSHHMIISFENELTERMDMDISFLWDRINHPAVDQNGVVPNPNDFRLMFGLDFTID